MFFKVEDGTEVIDSVKAAIKNGYRSIDTAAIYKNEDGVGPDPDNFDF
ncbi:YtbE (Aldo/keto reductase YtbE) [Bacillus pseudomycoides DSM 12442]|nr:YtbE (Aldo/keto reductase YtbE) [Bacillus pseudomycoides DSM 12442]